MSDIDWTPFDKYPESTCTCPCGAVFRSHAKSVMTPEPHVASRKPCPACGGTRLRGYSSDPELVTIGGKRDE